MRVFLHTDRPFMMGRHCAAASASRFAGLPTPAVARLASHVPGDWFDLLLLGSAYHPV